MLCEFEGMCVLSCFLLLHMGSCQIRCAWCMLVQVQTEDRDAAEAAAASPGESVLVL